MIDVTGDIEKALSENKAIVYFTASWCNPCRQLKPIYAEAGMKDKLNKYYVIDIDTIDSKYLEEYNIKSVPTLFVMENGKVSKTISGRTVDLITEQANS